jgi:hypothetical protein
MSFESDLEKYFTKTSKKLDDVSYNATVLVFSAVVFNTPVETGNLRGNWIPSVNNPITEPRELLDPTGEIVIDEIKVTVQPLSLNILTNNLVYAPVIEYGLYPYPTKKNTGRTQGGYSIQAPFGMIAPNILNWELFVKEAVKLAT